MTNQPTTSSTTSHKTPLTTVRALQPGWTITQDYGKPTQRALTVTELADQYRVVVDPKLEDGDEFILSDDMLVTHGGTFDIKVPASGPIADRMVTIARGEA